MKKKNSSYCTMAILKADFTSCQWGVCRIFLLRGGRGGHLTIFDSQYSCVRWPSRGWWILGHSLRTENKKLTSQSTWAKVIFVFKKTSCVARAKGFKIILWNQKGTFFYFSSFDIISLPPLRIIQYLITRTVFSQIWASCLFFTVPAISFFRAG